MITRILLIMFLGLNFAVPAKPQTFSIESFDIGPTGGGITVTPVTNRYFRLYEGDSLTAVTNLLGVFRGGPDHSIYAFPPGTELESNRLYVYMVQGFDACSPGDADEDGINDFYELSFSFLDPSSDDAHGDYDLDGASNYWEYRSLTHPGLSDDILCAFQIAYPSWQADSHDAPATGDRGFDLAPTTREPFRPGTGDAVGVARGSFNQDAFIDAAVVFGNGFSVDVYLAESDGRLGTPVSLHTGYPDPRSVVATDLIGNTSPDLAVAHLGGQLALFEGQGDGTFLARPDLTVSNLGSVVALASVDLDGDGDEDLVTSGGAGASVLWNEDSPQPSSPLQNGRFDADLNGWTVRATGQGAADLAGAVSVQSGQAVMEEGESFQVSLRQTFPLPLGPQTLTVSFASAGLSTPAFGLPDVIQVSLLGGDGTSLVPALAGQNAVFNLNPGGSVSTAPGTTYDGTRLVIDLSGLPSGTLATIDMTLVGNPNGAGASAAIDEVAVFPAVVANDDFTVAPLPGTFAHAAGIGWCDLVGNEGPDLIIDDAGTDVLSIFEFDGTNGFLRTDLDPILHQCENEIGDPGPPTAQSATAAATLYAKYLVADAADGRVYRHDAGGVSLMAIETPTVRTTGITAHPSGQEFWSIDGDLLRVSVMSHEGAITGEWGVSGLADPSGIAMLGHDLWVTDKGLGQLVCFLNGAQRGSGQAGPDHRLLLPPANLSPSGITAADELLWVVDDVADAVFAYATNGALAAAWSLDPANTDPSGITHSGRDLHVVDRADRRVYRYANALDFSGSFNNAAGHFALHPDNLAPEGIADPPTPINLGQVYTNHLIVANSTSQFSFAVAPGQQIFIDRYVGNVHHFEWTLEELGGAPVASENNWNDGGPYTLATGGDYVFTTIASGTNTGRLEWAIFAVPEPAVTDTNAEVTISGSIDVPGAIHRYRIPLTGPTNLFGDVVSGSQFDFNWELRDPSDQVVLSDRDFKNEDRFEITASGVYELTIDGEGDHVGAYSFVLYSVPSNAVRTVVTDVDITETFTVPGEEFVFEVDLAAPLDLFADVLVGSQFSFKWEMYDPVGGEVWSYRNFIDQGPLSLSQSGTYRIRVDGSDDDIGAIAFRLHAVPSNGVHILQLDQIEEHQLDVPGEIETFEVFLDAPLTLYGDVISGGLNTFTWRLLDPDGGIVFSTSNFSDVGPFAVTIPGTYTLVIDGRSDRTGGYSFALYNIPDRAPRPLDPGVAARGEINVPGEFDTYELLLTAGQAVYVDTLVGGLNTFEWQLTGPDDSTLLSSRNWSSLGPVVVPQTGLYRFVADGRISGTGFYSAVVDVVPQHPVETLPLHTPRSASFSAAGEVWEYTFEAVAGETNRFEFLHNENSAGRLQVFRPDGSSAFNNQSNARVLTFTQTGTYTGRVTSSNNQVAHFTLWRTSDPASPMPSGPDLVPSVTFQPGRLVANPATVDISWTVTNLGSNTTVGGWTDRIIVSTLDELEATRWVPADAAVPNGVLKDFPNDLVVALEERPAPAPLASGHSYTQSVSVVFPDQFEGVFFVYVQTDADNQVYELNEENNRFRREEMTAIFPQMTVGGTDGLLQLDLQDGDAFPVDEPVTLSGQARGVPERVNIFYIIDVSASTGSPNGLDANFDGILNADDDINGDNRVGDIYDVELGSIRVINQLLLDQGVVPNLVYIPFAGDGLRTDFSPDMLGQYFWDPVRDRDGDGQTDFEEFTLPIATFFGTDFDLPNQELVRLLPIAPDADQTEIFYFTDGAASPPDTNLLAEIAAYGVNLSAFQIAGADVSASLQAVADGVDAGEHSSGQAILVADPTDLATAVINTLDIAGVSVDGRGVARLDAAGNFFTPLHLVPGEQTFDVAAFDSEGNRFSRLLTLVGLTGPGDVESFQVVDALGTPRFQNLFHNPITGELTAELLIDNTSSLAIASPLLAVFDTFTPAAVRLLDADGTLDSGAPYLSFDTEITGIELAPAASTAPVPVRIENMEALRFGISLSLRAPSNQPPYFVSLPPVDAVAGQPWSYPAQALDGDDDPLGYRLATAPMGMGIDTNTGTLGWSPGSADVGTHPLHLIVADGRGGSAEQVFSLTVFDLTPNRPPVFQTFPLVQVPSGGSISYTPVVYDPDGDTLTFALPTSPGGTTFDPSSGRIDVLAPADGGYDFTLEVSDGRSGLAQQAFTVHVGTSNTGNGTPTFLSIPPIYALVDQPYLYLPLVVDPEGEEISYALLNGPSNLTLNTTNGLVQWLPTESDLGAHPVQLEATDTAGHEANQFFTLDVVAQASNLPPIIVSVPEDQATVDEAYAYEIRANDPEGQAVSYQLDQGQAGMILDPGTGELRWTPASSNLGSHAVSLRSQDPSGLSGFQTYTIQVKGPNLPPVFVSAPILEAAAGARYQYLAEATDIEDDVGFSLRQGPSGMSVNPLTGIVDWQPGSADIGAHAVRIEALDERGLSTFQDYTLDVIPDDIPPVVSVFSSFNLRAPGDSVDIQVVAVDNVALDTNSVTLSANGTPIALDANGEASFSTNDIAVVEFVASARDIHGNTGFGATEVRFYDSGDTHPPRLVITAPVNQDVVTAPTHIMGTADDPDGAFDYYTLEYAPASTLTAAEGSGGGAFLLTDGAFTLFHRGESAVVNGVLGTFDPTMLPNDDYVIRATAWDINGQGQQEGVLVSVAGSLKLGPFAYSFVDLEIPLAGIPIKISRAYNSLTARDRGAFGFGWTLSIADANIKETVPDNGLGFFGANPFYDGTRVYIDTPEGQRVGFTFRLEPSTVSPYLGASYLGVFEPDPGITYTLETDPPLPRLGQRGDGAAILFGVPFAYNPDRYTLTSREGIAFLYSQYDGLETIRDPGGNVITYTSTGLVHSAGLSIGFTRDGENRITEIRDPDGEAISYEYSAAGDLVARVDRVGGRSEYHYESEIPHYLTSFTDAAGRTPARTEYDENGRITAIIDEHGNRQEQTFDPAGFRGTMSDFNGNVVDLQYDAMGNLIVETDPLGFSNHYAYDSAGNLLTFTDRAGHVTSYTYDAAGNRLSETNAIGHVIHWTYDDKGRVTSVRYPDGSMETNRYGASGKVTNSVDRSGAVTTTTRFSNGQEQVESDPNGNVTTWERNAALLPSKQILADGSTNVYDYTNSGTFDRMTDAHGVVFELDTDKEGLPTQFRDGLGNGYSWTYEAGLVTDVADVTGASSRFEYDATGNILSSTNRLGDVSTFTFDGNANRLTVRDPLGNLTSNAFNAVNQQVLRIDAAGSETRMAYNPVLSVTNVVDRNGRETRFEYDALQRVVRETWVETGEVVNVIHQAYAFDGKRPTRVSDFHATYELEYNAEGRLTQERRVATNGWTTSTISWMYDAVGNVTSIVDRAGVRVDLTYDALNREVRRAWSGGPLSGASVFRDWYDATLESGIRRYADTSGVQLVSQTLFSYDAARRLETLRHADATGTDIARFDYAADNLNRITNWAHHGESTAFTYDAEGQVLSATGGLNESWSYDAGHNRDLPGLVLDPGNRLVADGVHTYAYDAEGNMTRRVVVATGEITAFTYDHRNRLTQVVRRDNGGGLLANAAYTYDARDRRILSDVDGTITRHTYADTVLWSDSDSGGSVTVRYLLGPDVDGLLARHRTGEGMAWYLSDHNHTVHDVLDPTGSVATHYDYTLFGGRTGISQPGAADRFGFTGREGEPVSGTLYFRARMYDPVTGRFLSEDPVGFRTGDLNLYLYARNNPLGANDPLGTSVAITYADIACTVSTAILTVAPSYTTFISETFKAVGEGLAGGTPNAPSFPKGQPLGVLLPCGLGGLLPSD